MTDTSDDTGLRVTRSDLSAAADIGVISPAQVEPLVAFLSTRTQLLQGSPAPSRFDVVHLLWYAGALIVMGAMGLFTTLAFSKMGGTALVVTAVVYAIAFACAGHYLWHKRKLQTPGGLLIAVAVSMVPLAVYGIQDELGMWSKFGKPGTVRDFYIWVKGSFVFMELATIAAAALALRFYRFPFIVILPAIALWMLSIDIVPWITGQASRDWEVSRKISVAFGLCMILLAIAVNLRQRRGDFAFWLYLIGVLTFWGGLSLSSESTEVTRLLYCGVNIAMLAVAALLGRTVFAVFGTIGIGIYLTHLSERVFRDSMMFPFALSLIGIAVIGLGLYLHRHRSAIDAWLAARLPAPLVRLRNWQAH